ncbi:uncharacterized protein LOC141568649 [Rhinolophus sinicus]|uniref:uncharacterized protein LOC141568649 n=1 Tax=Rhinolophus sinicus TaxID=89399 RepID=UPI003D7A571E
MHVEKKDVLGTKSMHLTKCNAILKSPLNRAALKTTSTRALRLTFYKPQAGGRHLTTGPQRGWERRCPQRLKVSFTNAALPGHAAARGHDALVGCLPPLRTMLSAPRRLPRIPKGSQGTAESTLSTARGHPTNRYARLRRRACARAAARLPFRGAQGPGCVLCRLPRSFLGAPTRPASHVAARQHFVGPGRLGGFITRRGRSMRTGGGVGLPGRRPLPPIQQPNSHSRLHTLSSARAGSRALAPPPRHVTCGRARPARCAPAQLRGRSRPVRRWDLPLDRPRSSRRPTCAWDTNVGLTLGS